jgi:large subunit ribosomal protein L25
MTFTITAQKRTSGAADALRADGGIPAVVYGPEIESFPVGIDYRTFEKLYQEAGESSLLDLAVDGGTPINVLIQDVQYDPVKGRIIHVDFRQIKMGEEMTATVELNFIGESDAVKTLGGTLNKTIDSVDVKCLPKDLVGHIDVDLSTLKTFDDVITIGSLTIPVGISITDNPDTPVAKVAAPLTEDQLKAMEESGPSSVDEIEVEKKKEEEAGEAEDGEKKEEGKE